MNNHNKLNTRGVSNELYRFDSLQVRSGLSLIKKESSSNNFEDSNYKRNARGSITYEEPTSDIGMCPPDIQRLPTYYWSLNSSTSSDGKKKNIKRKQQILFSSSSGDSVASEARNIRVKERKKSTKQINVAKRKLEHSRGNPFSTISSQTAIADYQTSAAYGILGCDCDFQRFNDTKQFPSMRTLFILDRIRSITNRPNNEKISIKNNEMRGKQNKTKTSPSNSPSKSGELGLGVIPASSLSNSSLPLSSPPYLPSNINHLNSLKSLDEGLMYYQYGDPSSYRENCFSEHRKLCTKSCRGTEEKEVMFNHSTREKEVMFNHSSSFQLHPLRSISSSSNQNSLQHQP